MLNINKLQSLIHSTNLSNEKVGEILGVSEQTIRYRKKNENWLADEIVKLSHYFKKDILWFYDIESEQSLNVIHEPEGVYGCKMCEQHERMIALLEDNIQLLKEKNNHLTQQLMQGNTDLVGKTG